MDIPLRVIFIIFFIVWFFWEVYKLDYYAAKVEVGRMSEEDYPLLCPKCKKNTVITDARGMIQYCTECDYLDDYPVEEKE